MATWKKIPFSDEVALLGSSTPAAVDGSSGSAGSATTASKVDHVHALGALVADVDAAQYSWKNLVIENLADAPDTPVLGQIYFKTGDTHIYVCTTA